MEPNVATSGGVPNRFATTRWSLIVSSVEEGGSDENAQTALAELCQIYWRPIFAFICRRGCAPTDAQDLTQDFFVTILDGNLLRRADPARGRFRSLLLKSLQHFLMDSHDKRTAQKRGGNLQFISWDDWVAEAPSQFYLDQQSLNHWSPERIFDVRWAATVVEQALRRLREECEGCGRIRAFDAISGLLSAERTDVSYDQVARALEISEVAVKRLVHRMRLRYRAFLREEVEQTVARPEDVEDEIRHLCAALAAGESAPK